MFAVSSRAYSCALTRSTPLAACFRTPRHLSWRHASLSSPYRLRNRCFGARFALSAIPRREVGRRCSGPTCPAPVSRAGCEPLSTASPCGRLSRPPSTPSGSDARQILDAPRGAAYLGVPQEPPGPPKFSTLLSTHPALFVDPGRPSGTSPSRSLCVGFWPVNTIAICLPALPGLYHASGSAVSPAGYVVPCVRFSWVVRAHTPPLQLQHSVRVAGQALPGRDSHPARSAKLRLAH